MIENAVYSRLTNYADLTALINNKVYPLLAPQAETSPFVVYTKVSSMVVGALVADTNIIKSRFQISAYAEGYDTCLAVAEQIRLALTRWRGVEVGVTVQDSVFESTNQNYNEPTEYFSINSDFFITYRNSDFFITYGV